MNECYFASLLDDVLLHFMNFYCMEGRKNKIDMQGESYTHRVISPPKIKHLTYV